MHTDKIEDSFDKTLMHNLTVLSYSLLLQCIPIAFIAA